MGLTQASCEPCRGGVPTLTPDEVRALLPEVPDWKVVEREGVSRIEREFTFKDFKDAMDFAVRVGALAEAEGHHPDLHVAWGKVRVETWTHKIHGLHKNDFILAAKIDALVGPRAGV
jgi:4a-hydroxytetrahydrobiopterin dehydratase